MELNIPLKELYIGYTDGRNEFELVDEEEFRSAFYLPPSVSTEDLIHGTTCFVEGKRGSGKTTFLRWLSLNIREIGVHSFLQFKSEVSEEKKAEYSAISGIKEVRQTSAGFETFQDFKPLWRILIIARIAETILNNSHCVEDVSPAEKILNAVGYSDENIGFFGYIPQLAKQIKITWTDVSSGAQFEAGLSNDSENEKTYTPDDLGRILFKELSSINVTVPIYVFIDEIEIFFKTPEQHKRDIAMVRDLIIIVEELNRMMRSKNRSIKIIAAIRTEVLTALSAEGEECYRYIDDYGVSISWTNEKSSPNHPLIQLILKKINVKYGCNNPNELSKIFPEYIFTTIWFHHLIDATMCMPRNMVTRLRSIREKYPNSTVFTKDQFYETENSFSKSVLIEIEYMLGAIYNKECIDGLKRCLYAKNGKFTFGEFQSRVLDLSEFHKNSYSALNKIDRVQLLERLFEFGAIGNEYFDPDTNRSLQVWTYRDEPFLQLDKPMIVHRSLWRALSIKTKS